MDPANESPRRDRLYFCVSRNAILRAVDWVPAGDYDIFKFEWVLAMSRHADNRQPEGFVESIGRRDLITLHEVTEMEAVAYASR